MAQDLAKIEHPAFTEGGHPGPPSLRENLPERGKGGPGPMAQDLATFQKFM